LQHYSGILGLGAATQYLKKIGMNNIQKHEQELTKTITEGLLDIKGFRLYGPLDPKQRGGITTFSIKGINHHDIALTLNSHHNIMVRSGAHCVHSWFNKHKIEGSVRASTYLYNTQEEAKEFVKAVKDVVNMLK
ncbi:aminotransferase class V-fold PLP-dependent enzyme, partial [Candidatus Woesearchaeota archaeon]|nr:aminotransferase class V-fold PLP-dependent enzyme [Candidatus Woesearchaeota archaeon]